MEQQIQEEIIEIPISTTETNETESLFRIMIASDHHLGYLENDEIRGDDSFNSFEEILSLAKAEKVDFLLLGGDLFHQHNPSKKTIIRTGKILQKYVYGQRTQNFEIYCYNPNFKNKNLSVQVPIFIIHGNHDDPSGFENFSSIDIYSNREVNYFGKINNYESFDLYPILFVKGKTKIALYGIGSMKDERLYLALQNKKVNFHRPDDYKNWFNILIVHQNRFKGHNIGKNKKNYLPESFIPNFIDLVVWGHEHECFTETVYNTEVGFHIYQPGSSVATSLIQAEAKRKHIGLCEIKGDNFRIIPIPLQSVRPFIYNQFELKQYAEQIHSQDDIERLIEQKIEEALKEVEEGRKDPQKIYNDLLPIIRIKIEYSGYAIVRTSFLIGKYSGKVANLNDMIQFWKKGDLFNIKKSKTGIIESELEEGNLSDEEMIDEDAELKKFVFENISNYFIEKGKKAFVNPDIFCDFLDKTVNGNERHSLEVLFKQFFDAADKSAKIENEVFTNLNILESGKRDYSEFLDKIISVTDINNQISTGKNYDLFKTRRLKKTVLGVNSNFNNLHLQSQNNFSNETKVDKNQKNLAGKSINTFFRNNKVQDNNNDVIDLNLIVNDNHKNTYNLRRNNTNNFNIEPIVIDDNSSGLEDEDSYKNKKEIKNNRGRNKRSNNRRNKKFG